jgi:hypothetical protein
MVQNVVGTSEINNNNTEFSIYPNLVKDILNIKSKEEFTKPEIFDSSGRI